MFQKLRKLFFSNPTVFKWVMNSWIPFLGMGIRIKHISPDYRCVDVEAKLTWYNKNYVNTHFGGCLSAMTDPFYMLILMKQLGPEYIVWDKSGFVDFIAPGRSRVSAHFEVTDSQIQDIKDKTTDGSKYLPVFKVDILDKKNQLIAKVERTIYIRKRRKVNYKVE